MAKSKEEKLKIMESVLIKMEDIKNTQQSLIEKLGQVEVDLFDIKSTELDSKLGEVHESAAKSFEIINEAKDSFEIKKNAIETGAI